MNSASQPSDRLKGILARARERSAAAAATAEVPAAQQRAQGEASVEALLDKTQPLPDPRALSRLYQEQQLTVRLPEEGESEAATATGAPPTAPAWGELPPPAPPPGIVEEAPPPVWADPVPQAAQSSQPTLSPAQIRAVMAELQQQFGGAATYQTYEIPTGPSDDYGAQALKDEEARELAELARLAEESAGSTWLYLLGAGLVVVIIGAFIWLAVAGPLKAPPAPSASPTVAAHV